MQQQHPRRAWHWWFACRTFAFKLVGNTHPLPANWIDGSGWGGHTFYEPFN